MKDRSTRCRRESSPTWSSWKASGGSTRSSAEAVYQALRDAVLPPARPDEVFLYATPLNVNALRRPQSASKLLAAWAVKAGKADELKQALAARKGQPMAELPVAILNAQLAQAMDDPAATIAALKAIAARLKQDTSRNTTDLACHVAIPALDRPQAEVASAAIDVLDAAAKGMESASSARAAGIAAAHPGPSPISTGRRRRRPQAA